MAKAKSGFILKTPLAVKKIEKDIDAFQFSVGHAGADLANIVQLEIRNKGFLPAIGTTVNKGRSKQYKRTAGANLASKKNEELRFHKSKIVNRNDTLPQIFEELKFKKHGFGKLMYSASNDGIDVKITREKKNIIINYAFKGKYDKIFGQFEGGRKTIQVKSISGRVRNKRIGHKRIVSSGFRRAVRRWKKLNNFRIEQALKKRSLARI